MKSSTMTGVAAILFGGGIVALIAAIFRYSDQRGGPLVWVALALLAATVVCWFAAARVQGASK